MELRQMLNKKAALLTERALSKILCHAPPQIKSCSYTVIYMFSSYQTVIYLNIILLLHVHIIAKTAS